MLGHPRFATSCSTIDAGHVHVIQGKVPQGCPHHDQRGGVGQRNCGSRRTQNRPGPHEMLFPFVEALPQIAEDIGAVSDSVDLCGFPRSFQGAIVEAEREGVPA